MKTYKLIGLFLLAITLNITACSDGDNDESSAPNIEHPSETPKITLEESITTNGLAFTSKGGNQSISFTSNDNWSLSVASTTSGTTWCTPSVTSGSKGTANVSFTVTPNESYDNRSVSVTIKCGSASKTFTISQKCVEALLVSTDKYEIDQEGGTLDIEVQANIDYQIEISESAKGWITETESRGLTAHKHSFTIAANEGAEKREGEINIKSGDKVETIKVYQVGGSVLLLSQNEFTISSEGETISVEIQSNVEFEVQMPYVDWIMDEASSRGLSSHTLKYVIVANEGYDNRSAQIIYYDKNSELKDTLTITQVQKDAIILSEKFINIPTEGDTINVKLDSNIEYEILLDCEWIKLIDNSTRSLVNHQLSFEVEQNTTEESRSSEIIITNKDKNISETLSVTQLGPILILQIDEPGTLPNLISAENKYKITSLKLIGDLNAADIKFVRDMAGVSTNGEKTDGKLNYLDLSETNIVEGGGYYSYSYRTKNNIISTSMFGFCRSLESIILPFSVTKLEHGAFMACNKLKSIKIPEGITSIGEEAFWECNNLEHLELPQTVTTISCRAFMNCTSLKEFTTPNNVSTIEDGTFYGCTNLSSFYINSNIQKVGVSVFSGCDNLKEINVDTNNQFYTSVEGVLYNKDITELIKWPNKKKEINIHNNVRIIKKYAFDCCYEISSLTLPQNVEIIEESAFACCYQLATITLPQSLKKIENYAFNFCNRLHAITIPENVNIIEIDAFFNCENLEHIFVDEKNSIFSSFEGILYDKDMTTLIKCPMGKKSIQFSNSTNIIGKKAFSYCYNLVEISIPDNITEIENGAFLNCINLKSVNIPKNVISIKEDTFRDCNSLISFIIPENIQTIENFAFCGNSNLSEIKVYIKEPLEIKARCFYDVNMSECKLYVPKGSKELYNTAKYWSDFKNIIEMED